jgi:hypothetical protein
MAFFRTAKTSFTGGELAPELLGRQDLQAWANGATKLRNVFVQPTGGVTRRPGLRHIAMLPGPAKLIPFEFNTEQTYLIVLTDRQLSVFAADVNIAQLGGPWTADMLDQIAWTQSADTLLLCHPAMPPQRVTRTGATTWTVAPWAFVNKPFHRFAAAGTSLSPSATTGSVQLASSDAVFDPLHVGVRFRIAGKRVLITGVASPQQASANVIDALVSTAATMDWDEEAFSPLHGWPVTACFHQNRLVFGGARDLPNRIWLSRTGNLYDFDLGTGLDSEAIEFAILSDQVNAVRAVFSGRNLQIFTSGAEYVASGAPLTPTSIQIARQTRIGSPVTRLIQPVDVDGATVFLARSGRAVYAFDTTLLPSTYQATDLALTARHLFDAPVDMAYDQRSRLLHIAMSDGSMATLTIYRQEQVTAWSRQETAGTIGSLACIEGQIWAVVQRQDSRRLERFDTTLALDACLDGTAAPPTQSWGGLAHLDGQEVGILADGASAGTATVIAGSVTLDDPAGSTQIGLPFAHEIIPLPPNLATSIGVGAAPLRLVALVFRLLSTSSLAVDLGTGVQQVPFRRLGTPLLDAPPGSFTGDVRLKALGWRRDASVPLWRIRDDTPLPMTLLSVTTEMRTTD